MKIIDFLSKDSIVLDVASDSKKKLLEELSLIASSKTGVDSRVILDALIERERLGTTGVGRGVALPHTRLLGLDKIFCAFIKTNPVDFEAVDSKLVDLVFLLLVPEESGADHLKALARISKLLRDEQFASSLRKMNSVDDVYRFIEENDADE